jgi:Na+/H+ antiporter NhaD/arsenite permease-like protein
MFAGLFFAVAGFVKALLLPAVTVENGRQHVDRMPVLALVTARLSNLVNNVPAALALKPLIVTLPDRRRPGSS